MLSITQEGEFNLKLIIKIDKLPKKPLNRPVIGTVIGTVTEYHSGGTTVEHTGDLVNQNQKDAISTSSKKAELRFSR